MTQYTISITDNQRLTGDMKCKAQNKAQAMQIARDYIRAWSLEPATINSITEVEPC
jgi:hypothetical protein